MTIFSKVKALINKIKPEATPAIERPNYITISSMEQKYENNDLIGAARDLKNLLEAYGRRKRKNHRYKGRVFIHFILSSKSKDLKNTGYTHWQNMIDYIKLNQTKIYPYHKNNLRNAIDFFKKEIKGLSEIRISTN